MLRLALRETLLRNGIPPAWISVEALRSVSRQGPASLHVRLRIHVWNVRLLPYLHAIEEDFLRRVGLFGTEQRQLVRAVSWQFALAELSACPPLPHPGTWTALPKSAPEDPASVPAQLDVGVIAGPVLIGSRPPSQSPSNAHAPGRHYAQTLPAALHSGPVPLNDGEKR